ncbi:MAG: tRNA (adenosine(37)-N6)-dimethylallyltransferase MiaA [Rhodobacteraceae bacterium]|nr:tRNA (adenosine(37)-N6)-dimethylallyltransferase MiaA [Paracoccaceae bacterium]
MPKRTVLIAGATASGKTGLAIKFAERIGGIIINADALQVYSKWRVLTARPSQEELAQAPHHLYGHIEETSEYSVGAWIKEVTDILQNTEKPAVIIGGTGLYFGALLNGLSEIPPIPADIRAAGDAHRLGDGATWFQTQLLAKDAETYAKLDQNNPARLQRAWEVLEATGKGLSYWHARPIPSLLSLEETVPILLNWQVNDLNCRIDTRFDTMMESGAIAECEAAMSAGFDANLPANRAIGATEIIKALDGKTTMQDAVIKSKTLTHQFAKRQRTWFRSKMRDWQHIDMSEAPNLDEVIGSILR